MTYPLSSVIPPLIPTTSPKSDLIPGNLWSLLKELVQTRRFNTRTATGMDGTLTHCIFENLKPVDISKICLTSFEHL